MNGCPCGLMRTCAVGNELRSIRRAVFELANLAAGASLGSGASQEATGVEREEQLFACPIDLEVGGLFEEGVDGFHRTGAKVRSAGMSVRRGVLDDEVAARLDEGCVGSKLRQHVISAVIAVEHDERARAFRDATAYLVQDASVDGRAREI